MESSRLGQRSTQRLFVFTALVLSLMLTLAGRMYQLQAVDHAKYESIASSNRTRDIITNAPRGQIVDQSGVPLVANRSSLVITADPTTLHRQKDRGRAVFNRLGALVGLSGWSLSQRMKPCGTPGAPRPPVCWNGSSVQPVPLVKDADQSVALAVVERVDQFRGLAAQVEGVRDYPGPFGVNAAHMLGYLQPVNDAELSKQAKLPREQRWLLRNDLVGRSGLESMYDRQLRGAPGIKQLVVDNRGHVVGTLIAQEAKAGNTLVSSISAPLQAVAEKALSNSVKISRSRGYPADSGAIVVLDVTNGRVLALASYPTYDPNIWVGRVETKQYQALLDPKKGTPLLFRPTQGLFPPGSTFKVVTTSAALDSGWTAGSRIPCPSTLQVGRKMLSNFDGERAGSLTLAEAIEMSCNTVFYRIGYDLWRRDGGTANTGKAQQSLYHWALNYHLGKKTGIDLESEARGRIAGRQERLDTWNNMKSVWCHRGEVGYPEYKSRPSWAAYLKGIAAENCTDGYLYRGGDAALFAIGQGDTLVTPLQMAVLYASIANGGTLWQPTIAKAFVSADGKTTTPVAATKIGTVGLSDAQLRVLRNGLHMVVTGGTASGTFSGYPESVVPVAGKTGTAQMGGNHLRETSWFSSFAPLNNPRYAVVAMVSQGGTGASSAGVAVRKVYEAIFGVKGGKVDPALSVFPGGAPLDGVPHFSRDGRATLPAAERHASASPSTAALSWFGAAAAVLIGGRDARRRKQRKARLIVSSGGVR
jgi:penicillin-binding protein 2